jgi:hypothetical protein
MLVCGAGCIHGILDASLRAGINIVDIVSVLCLKLIELVNLILDGGDLSIYPLLAGERVHMTPETLLRLICEGLAGGVCG